MSKAKSFNLFGITIWQNEAARQEKREDKLEYKTTKVEVKGETKQTAFSNGIDPNQSMWGGLSSMFSSLGGTVASILSPSGNFKGLGFLGGGSSTDNKSDYILPALFFLFLLYLIFSKKSRN